MLQEPLRLEAFSRCQGEALTRIKRVVREEWPQRVGTKVHDALRRQGAEGAANAAGSSAQGGAAGSQSPEQVTQGGVGGLDGRLTPIGTWCGNPPGLWFIRGGVVYGKRVIKEAADAPPS